MTSKRPTCKLKLFSKGVVSSGVAKIDSPVFGERAIENQLGAWYNLTWQTRGAAYRRERHTRMRNVFPSARPADLNGKRDLFYRGARNVPGMSFSHVLLTSLIKFFLGPLVSFLHLVRIKIVVPTWGVGVISTDNQTKGVLLSQKLISF